MHDLTKQQLAELARLEEAATPGEWQHAIAYDGTTDPEEMKESLCRMIDNGLKDKPEGSHLFGIWYEKGDVIPAITGNGPKGEPNAQLIAASRNHLRALIDMARRTLKAEAEVAGLQRVCDSSYGVEKVLRESRKEYFDEKERLKDWQRRAAVLIQDHRNGCRSVASDIERAGQTQSNEYKVMLIIVDQCTQLLAEAQEGGSDE